MCRDNEEWFKIWRGLDLSISSKLTWRIWQILTQALRNLKNLHFNGLLLTRVYVWELKKKVRRSYLWLHWRLLQNLKENWPVLSKITWKIWEIFVHRLKNSNFILENKMAEPNKNKNSKQPDLPDAVWKLYFTLEINNTINKIFCTRSTESLFLRYKRTSKKVT